MSRKFTQQTWTAIVANCSMSARMNKKNVHLRKSHLRALTISIKILQTSNFCFSSTLGLNFLVDKHAFNCFIRHFSPSFHFNFWDSTIATVFFSKFEIFNVETRKTENSKMLKTIVILAGICLNLVSQTLAVAIPDPFDDDKTPAQHWPPYAESRSPFMDFLGPYNRQTNGDGSP